MTGRSPDTVRVLLVGGTGRSGSTLVANALASAGGVVSAGEVRFAPLRGLAGPGTCGCRRPVRSCPVWIAALEEAYGSVPSPSEAAEMHAQLTHLTRLRTLPRHLWPRDIMRQTREVAAMVGRIHVGLARVTDARVVVDSSKLPTYASLLRHADAVDLRVVHLVRDPRAAAWSWQRRTASRAVDGLDAAMDRFPPAKSALLWTIWNSALPRLFRHQPGTYALERYEDLMTAPRDALVRMLEHAGLTGADLPFTTPTELDIPVAHTVAGNPSRFRSGPTVFAADTEWVEALPRRDRATVEWLSRPARSRLGYP